MSTSDPSSGPSRIRVCSECDHPFPIKYTSCPHCGRPQLFPNVSLACDEYEYGKLVSSFGNAIDQCQQDGIGHLADHFTADCSQSKAVFNCWLPKLFREVASVTHVFETYHQLERLRLRESIAAQELDFEKLRPQAEVELFGSPDHLDKIHYACLSIDGNGLGSYGDCCVQLAESMIAHRASCFEGNTALIYHQLHSFSDCLRSDWEHRNLLCLAALVEHIGPSTIVDDFAKILVDCGARQEDDRFIEVHVFGSMTAKTFQFVQFDATQHGPNEEVLRQMVEQKLGGAGVQYKVVRS